MAVKMCDKQLKTSKKKQSKLKTRQYVDMQQFLEANRPQGHFLKKKKQKARF